MKTQHTFDFGYGPVAAARHTNPDGSKGGWVAATAIVEEGVRLDPNAQVYGSAQVYGFAQVSGSAQVYGFARVSVNPVCVTGYEYDVTVSDTHIAVGCQCHTIEVWRTLKPENCPLLEQERECILWMAQRHQSRIGGAK